MDAIEEQQGTEGSEQPAVGIDQEAEAPEGQGRAAAHLQPVEEPQSCHKPKRHFSRSMDLSGSGSSRAAKHHKQSENGALVHELPAVI